MTDSLLTNCYFSVISFEQIVSNSTASDRLSATPRTVRGAFERIQSCSPVARGAPAHRAAQVCRHSSQRMGFARSLPP